MIEHEKQDGPRGEFIETVITSEGFLNWKHHVERCVTKKHHKYNDLLQTSCKRYFRFFNTPLHWGERESTGVTRIEDHHRSE